MTTSVCMPSVVGAAGRVVAGEMQRAYSELYLSDAMQALGEFFDFAVNDYGAEGDEVADLFCMSEISAAFERGDPRYVGGMSGLELFECLNEEAGAKAGAFAEHAPRFERTSEFWLGWTAAYVQWRLAVSFEALFRMLPYDEFLGLYRPWHEASEERFCELVSARVRDAGVPTNLARLRRSLGLTQRELAYRSGVALRSIQLYEQRQKDINKAQALTLRHLAQALFCPMESLLERF